MELTTHVEDFRRSGLSAGFLGIDPAQLYRHVIPFNEEYIRQHCPKEMSAYRLLFDSSDHLRPRAGYCLEYPQFPGRTETVIRFRNLDPAFLEWDKKHRCPKVDRLTGRPIPQRYVSLHNKTHLYLDADDLSALSSNKGILIFGEGEKKTDLLRYLLRVLVPRFEKLPYIDEAQYAIIGSQGVYNWGTEEFPVLGDPQFSEYGFSRSALQGKHIYIVFDADWYKNPQVAMAELRLVGMLLAHGASLGQIKSLQWSESEGKGIDDYCMGYYTSTFHEEPIYTQADGWKLNEDVKEHPMLLALNSLFKSAVNPLEKMKMMGMGFLIRGIVSCQRAGYTLDSAMIEETIDRIKKKVFVNASVSTIRSTFREAVKAAQNENILRDPFPTQWGLSERVAASFEDRFVAVANAKGGMEWMTWTNEGVWQEDVLWHADAAARETIHEVANELLSPDAEDGVPALDPARRAQLTTIYQAKWQTEPFLRQTLAGAASGCAFRREHFDKDVMLFNCRNGILHLNHIETANEKDSQFFTSPHNPKDYCTMRGNVIYKPLSTAPEWIKFVNMILNNVPKVTGEGIEELLKSGFAEELVKRLAIYSDDDYTEQDFADLLIETVTEADLKFCPPALLTFYNRPTPIDNIRVHLQRRMRSRQGVYDLLQSAVGLSVSGKGGEKNFFFCHGEKGDNGKSTFFNVLQSIFGSYFYRLPIQYIMENRGGSTNNDGLADMCGKRLVVTTETPHYGRLNVELLKDMTGGEQIGASRKYERLIKFLPTWVFFMFGNKKPGVGVARDPFWERMLLIEFPIRIPDVLPASQLLSTDMAMQKLLREEDGIFLWCLEGWQRYRQHRFVIPDEVRQATKMYQHDMDQIGQFSEECLIEIPGAELTCKVVWDAYKKWFEGLGLSRKDMVGRTKFYADLEERGFPKIRSTRQANLPVFCNLGLRDETLRDLGTTDAEEEQPF